MLCYLALFTFGGKTISALALVVVLRCWVIGAHSFSTNKGDKEGDKEGERESEKKKIHRNNEEGRNVLWFRCHKHGLLTKA